MFFFTAGSLGGGGSGLHASEDHSMSGKVSTWQQEQTEVFKLWTKKRGNNNVITRSKRRCLASQLELDFFWNGTLGGTRCWILEVLTRDKLPCSWSRFVRHWRSCSSAFGMGIGIWVCHIWLEKTSNQDCGQDLPHFNIHQTNCGLWKHALDPLWLDTVSTTQCNNLCFAKVPPVAGHKAASAIPPGICLKLGSYLCVCLK